jgi:hypothetical protein
MKKNQKKKVQLKNQTFIFNINYVLLTSFDLLFPTQLNHQYPAE